MQHRVAKYNRERVIFKLQIVNVLNRIQHPIGGLPQSCLSQHLERDICCDDRLCNVKMVITARQDPGPASDLERAIDR